MCSVYKIILLLFIVITTSCKVRRESGEDECSISQANKLMTDYILSRDTAILTRSYQCLSANEEFNHEGITRRNYDVVFSILMYSRKYDELEHLMSEMDFHVEGEKQILNMIKALSIYKEDSIKAFKYIYNNMATIREQIDEDPLDSTLYTQYFMMRLYLDGREKCLVALDSFKSVNNRFTDVFYDHILRDLIKEYPNEYMFTRHNSYPSPH